MDSQWGEALTAMFIGVVLVVIGLVVAWRRSIDNE